MWPLSIFLCRSTLAFTHPGPLHKLPDLYPVAGWKWTNSCEIHCNAGLCFHCHQPGSPHEPAAQAPGSSPLEAPLPRVQPESTFGWTLETIPGPQGVLRSGGAGAEKDVCETPVVVLASKAKPMLSK